MQRETCKLSLRHPLAAPAVLQAAVARQFRTSRCPILRSGCQHRPKSHSGVWHHVHKPSNSAMHVVGCVAALLCHLPSVPPAPPVSPPFCRRREWQVSGVRERQQEFSSGTFLMPGERRAAAAGRLRRSSGPGASPWSPGTRRAAAALPRLAFLCPVCVPEACVFHACGWASVQGTRGLGMWQSVWWRGTHTPTCWNGYHTTSGD